MKWSNVTSIMRLSGTITGGRDVHWLRLPSRKNGSFASILGLQEIGRRPLRITSTAAPNMTSQVAGNQLSLSWPPDHLGWHLQVQTNAPGVGLTNVWVDLTATASVTNFTTTINPANGSVFYRLVYP